MNYWSFRELEAIEEPVFNNTLERFYKLGIEGLVRENIQNSLDGKIKDFEGAVEVTIKTGTVTPEAIPGMNEIIQHISSLKGGNLYTNSTISYMQSKMHQQTVHYISFEDYNTKGLTGANKGENFGKEDTWGVYAYKKGVHFTEEDIEAEKLRGGSHGVGKIASNAASDLYMMFFANCDIAGNQHLGGTVQLIEHELNGKTYRASGYFTNLAEDNHTYIPFENHFDEIFEKNTRGLKIVIPFLREQYQDEKSIIRAVCDNFFVAIYNNKLSVKINNLVINSTNLDGILSNPDIYPEQARADMKSTFAPLYFDTFENYQPVSLSISDLNKSYDFTFYLQYDKEIKRCRIAVIRGIGMKIEDKKIPGFVNSPFNGILIPANSEGDTFLKTLENESHTELSAEHIKDPSVQKNAKKFIKNLENDIKGILEGVLRKENPSDGKIDTSELIYSVDRNFRKELSKEMPTVQLTKGDKDSKKSLVKVKASKKKKKDDKEKKKREKKRIIDRLTRHSKKKDDGTEDTNRIRYNMEPESVKRIVLDKKEILAFDFSQVAEYSGESACDISLNLIDGTGKSYNSEFNVKESYASIIDKGTNRTCKVEGDVIKGVSITDSKVQLEMETTAAFNKSLKFMYLVEV